MGEPKWLYIGKYLDVTPCDHRNNGVLRYDPDSSCFNGSCPGYIKGHCPFSGGDPFSQYRELFVLRAPLISKITGKEEEITGEPGTKSLERRVQDLEKEKGATLLRIESLENRVSNLAAEVKDLSIRRLASLMDGDD